jgi:hypothetical protein
MKYVRPCLSLFAAMMVLPAAPASSASLDALAKGLAPHKAVYDIDLVATHSGSQIVNISGKMSYDYADAVAMKIVSDFSTYESFDGKTLDFTSRRKRDGELYQDIRGHADLGPKGGSVVFSKPADLKYDLGKGALFPMAHTLELISHAKAGDKFYSAEVFDGSDDEGPIEINTFIGKSVTAHAPEKGSKVDGSLLTSPAWNVRMAVFPIKDQEEESDYEMSLVFHENGVISDMLIEYDDFSVKQKLISLEKLSADSCETAD